MFATVAIDAPVDTPFDYHIPPEIVALDGGLQPGHLVEVAFRTAKQHGIVLDVHDESSVEATKPILARLDARPVVTPMQIALSQWISAQTLAPLGPCLWLWLPPGLTNQRDLLITLLDQDAQPADPLEAEVVALLRRRGRLLGRQLTRALPAKNWRAAVEGLRQAGSVAHEPALTPPTGRPTRSIQTASLAIHPNEITQAARHLERVSRTADLLEVIAAAPGPLPIKAARKAARATKANLDKLIAAGLVTLRDPETVALAVPPEDVAPQLNAFRKLDKPLRILKLLARSGDALDVSWVYAQADATLADLKKLEEEELILLGETPRWRDSVAERDFVPTAPPTLTPDQAAAWGQLEARLTDPPSDSEADGSRVILLHGVTGSGKTELYLRAIAQTLKQGRDALFLVPEIALTPQTIRRVAARFPGQVAVVHGKLSTGERYDTWRRARDGLIRVVVGTRSALFTPLPDVGLIILDEFHDHSYKQAPPLPLPYYDARRVAEAIARQNNGLLILGSATPDVETAYRAAQGAISKLSLPSRVLGHRTRIDELAERAGVLPRYRPESGATDALTIDLPPVEIVDMRLELKRGNTSIFSRALQTAITETLDRGEQAILFLNRRGQATYVFCRDCGYVASCPNCDTPLTYHRHGEHLRCHRCGHAAPVPGVCPRCVSRRIKYFGAGTQHIEQAVHELFPRAWTARWDGDTATLQEAHEAILQRFIDRKADILIGTQMIAKGLDLPLVTLVGVVSADVGLALPDFRAGERAFQLLTQVAGRAGRGVLGGRVILQTYQPDHYAVVAAAQHDYAAFYAQEIAYRRDMGYPPFRRLLRVVFHAPNEAQAQAEATRAAGTLQHRLRMLNMNSTELIGPAPCFFAKENNIFRWHVLLRGPDPTLALRDFTIPRGWHVDVDPVDVL
ncbi:MAG: primosomal protein N' [Chloroflexi bacterium]|nr:primosomal protein N' [Chloroflexota bacterium]